MADNNNQYNLLILVINDTVSYIKPQTQGYAIIGTDSLRSSALRSCGLKIKILLAFREVNATQDHKRIQMYPSVALRSTSINAKGT